jgi:hypothetical protein
MNFCGVISIRIYQNEERKMITFEENERLLNVAVLGEFTLADFRQFEDAALLKLNWPGEVDLLIDLRDMITYTLDVALEELRFFGKHQHDFTRIAVVTTDQWRIWSAWFSRVFMDAEVCTFEDYEEAKAWVAGA